MSKQSDYWLRGDSKCHVILSQSGHWWTFLNRQYSTHQIESDWLNPDSNKPGTYVFPEDFRPKYGHFDMIFPSDVEVVRKGETKSREVHAFPADRHLLRCAESAASRVQ